MEDCCSHNGSPKHDRQKEPVQRWPVRQAFGLGIMKRDTFEHWQKMAVVQNHTQYGWEPCQKTEQQQLNPHSSQRQQHQETNELANTQRRVKQNQANGNTHKLRSVPTLLQIWSKYKRRWCKGWDDQSNPKLANIKNEVNRSGNGQSNKYAARREQNWCCLQPDGRYSCGSQLCPAHRSPPRAGYTAPYPTASRVTPGGSGTSAGTKKSGIKGLLGSTL